MPSLESSAGAPSVSNIDSLSISQVLFNRVSSRNSRMTPRASAVRIQKVEEDSLESLSSFKHSKCGAARFGQTDRRVSQDQPELVGPLL